MPHKTNGDVSAKERVPRNPQVQCMTFPFGKRMFYWNFSHRPTGTPGGIWTYVGETCDLYQIVKGNVHRHTAISENSNPPKRAVQAGRGKFLNRLSYLIPGKFFRRTPPPGFRSGKCTGRVAPVRFSPRKFRRRSGPK